MLFFEHFDAQVLLPEERKFANTLAVSLSAVLENISYFHSMGQKAKTDAELNAAKLVQQSLLPECTHVEIPHGEVAALLRSAQETGGDWFSYNKDKCGQKLTLYVGDVTGHGISSALMTGVASGAISVGEFAAENNLYEKSAHEQLLVAAHCVNHALFKNARRTQRLMTMALLAFDTQTGELAFVNAAHVHPLIVKKSGKAMPLMGSGPRLGFLEKPVFQVRKVMLEPGDFVFIYTDGLTENEQFKRQVFCSRALPSFLQKVTSATEALARIVEAAEKYWKDRPPLDDVTLMVLHWRGNNLQTPPGTL